MLNVIDEFTHECLAIRVARKLKAIDVIDVLSDLFILRGVPGHIRSDNGPEFIAKAVQDVDRGGRSQDGLHRSRQPVGDLTLAFLCCSGSERASICAAACFVFASPLEIILAIRWTSA